VTQQDELQRRIRRNALWLGLVACAFYLAYYLIQMSRTAG
jgi:hypothetical protein